MPGEDRDCERHQNDGGDLRRIEFFLQKHCPEEDAEQRIDEITQSRIERATRTDRPDIDTPVDADQSGRKARHGKHFRVFQRRPDFRRPPDRYEYGSGDRHRPDDAVNDDLDRRNMRNRLHVEGKEPPQQICGKRESKTARAIAALLGRERFIECHGSTANY